MTNLAIFASGKGSNAEAIISHFKKAKEAEVALIVTNNPVSGVVQVAQKHGIPVQVVDKNGFYESQTLLRVFKQHDIGFIALAGFLWLIPSYIIDAFPGKLVNIHPALLPRHGGKGMYGDHVHQAILDSGDKESGITIHNINNRFDEGEIIFQAKCPVLPGDDIAALEARVRQLEHLHYPQILSQLLIKETVTHD